MAHDIEIYFFMIDYRGDIKWIPRIRVNNKIPRGKSLQLSCAIVGKDNEVAVISDGKVINITKGTPQTIVVHEWQEYINMIVAGDTYTFKIR